MPDGETRRVFLVGTDAIKLPRMANLTAGLRCNRWEREMWRKWRSKFAWATLCPVLFADPIGLFLVMPRAEQPVEKAEVDALPDYHHGITSEPKLEDYGRVGQSTLALNYALDRKTEVQRQRQYSGQFTNAPATIVSK